ncbi:hypothetical protein A5742_08620 [Mycolicibacterium fortuitum]|uniref:Uncharacterized protein n=1 Tax=Mycolicibacterium fortuitum TaxID=1766 RepID=A0ABD6QHK0_MYCFO|nr:hypothetical protein [Mycolicibacterium fortuitum]OMC37688.1 hypothetical protein A5742_08620 [Mycolicibacterium fortuitum]
MVINDGTVYDGDPATNDPPGEFHDGPAWGGPRRWKVQSLMTGGITTYRASSQDDAIAQYLGTVTSNMLVEEVTEGVRSTCKEPASSAHLRGSPPHPA